MADERIPITYTFDNEKHEIHRKRGKGAEILEDKVVATYDPETQVVVFPNLSFLKSFKTGVMTFLAENELLVKSWQRADIEPDEPNSKKIPPRPKKTKYDGDKTPAVVDWYYRHKPNEFATRYGVIARYTGLVSYLVPQWEPRPVDGLSEYRGAARREVQVRDVMLATRAVCGMDGQRLTYTPDECPDWNEDEEDGDNEEEQRGGVVARGRNRNSEDGGDE